MVRATSTARPSALSRRAALAGSAATLLTPATSSRHASILGEADPVLALWQRWRKLYDEAEVHRAKWLKAESLLFRTVGFPTVTVRVPGERPVRVTDPDAIDDLLGTTPEARALREQLRADLAAHQRRWDEAVAALGFDELEERQDAAHRRAEAMTEPLFATPAGSLAGVAAKLALVLELGQPSPRDREFPWPQLRSALDDLQRLASIPTLPA
jgi:hypothetical protein